MKKLLENDYLLSIISKFSNIIFGFIALIFLNRYLGAELKGKYSLIINYVMIVSVIFQLGINSVYSKFKRKKIENVYECFILLSLVQFVLYGIISIIVSLAFKSNKEIVWIATLSTISILTTQLRYINLVENMKYNAFVVIIMSLLNALFTITIFLVYKRNLDIALLLYVIKDLIVVLLYITKIPLKAVFSKKNICMFKSIIKEGFLPMLSSLLIMINYKVDLVMLDTFNVYEGLIGLYALGLSISEYIWIVPDVFKDVIQKRTAKSNPISSINFSLRVSTTIVITIFVIFVIFGKFAYKIAFGQEFIGAYPITIILFVGVYSMVYYKIIGHLFIADNKSKSYFIILAVGAMTNVLLNVILIPYYSIYGAAIASVSSYSIIGLIFLKKYLKEYNVKGKDTLFINKEDLKRCRNLFRVKNEKDLS